MQHLYSTLEGSLAFTKDAAIVQALVRFFDYHRIKPRAPPLVREPANSFEF